MTRHFRLLLIFAVAAALLFTACTGNQPEPAATSPAETTAGDQVESSAAESTAAVIAETMETSVPESTEAAPAESTAAAETEPALIEAPSVSAEEFPVTDGSTATLPLSWMLYRLCTGEDQQAAEEAMHFTKTNNAYLRLMDGDADLVIAYEPGPNAKADPRYGDIVMEPIGLDALIFICNTANSVESLTSEEIRDIYTDRITNWKEVGGADSEIIAFQREVNSGSQTLMENLMMKGTPMAPAPVEFRPSEMGDLIESVARYANTGNALGYSVYFYAKNMYAKPNLRFMAVDGIMPSNDTIRSGEYAYTNPFYAAIRKDEPKDSRAYELFTWLTTDDGQSLVEAMDYVSMEKGSKKLPDELIGKTSLLPSGLEDNTHRLAVNGRSYDGNAGVVLFGTDGQFLRRMDDIRIRDDDEYALIRGSVFPASLPLYAKPRSAEGEGTDGSPWTKEAMEEYFSEYYTQNIPIGLYDADAEKWAVEPCYDYCYTECTDKDQVIFYMGNWWSYDSYDENGNYVYVEDPEATVYLYDGNGNLLETRVVRNWEELDEMTSNTLLQHHGDVSYYEDTSETVYNLGGSTRLIQCYADGQERTVLEIGGRVAAAGTGGYVLPYMSDFTFEDKVPAGWSIVHLYDMGNDENGDYYYHEKGQYVINSDGKLAYVLKARDNETIDIVDKYFLVVSNYDSGKHSLIDYAGNEITSWITPEDYEYADWWS